MGETPLLVLSTPKRLIRHLHPHCRRTTVSISICLRTHASPGLALASSSRSQTNLLINAYILPVFLLCFLSTSTLYNYHTEERSTRIHILSPALLFGVALDSRDVRICIRDA